MPWKTRKTHKMSGKVYIKAATKKHVKTWLRAPKSKLWYTLLPKMKFHWESRICMITLMTRWSPLSSMWNSLLLTTTMQVKPILASKPPSQFQKSSSTRERWQESKTTNPAHRTSISSTGSTKAWFPWSSSSWKEMATTYHQTMRLKLAFLRNQKTLIWLRVR